MADTKGMFDTQEIQPVKKQHTELELEMLAIKRKMRERSEERVAHSQKYMQSNPAVTQIIADFFEAALTEQPADFYVFARDHFLGQMRPREPETFDVDTATMEAEILDIMELKEALDACGEDTAGTKPELVERLVNARWAAYEAAQPAPAPAPVDPITPMVDARSPVRAVIISCHDDHDSKDLRRACGVLVARRPHLARPKTQYVLAKDPELPPLPVLDAGYGALSAVQGPAPAPLEGEDIFVSEEDPNAKRPRITQGRIDAGASRHEWFEHDGLHCTSFGSIGEACTRCVGGAAVVCVAGPDRAGAARRTAFSLGQAQPLVVRVQQHERWDTHDAQLAETRIGADDDGNDVILPLYDYALTYTGVGDLADQLEAIADAEERLAPPLMREGWREPRDLNI
jgi:hypothetical protein